MSILFCWHNRQRVQEFGWQTRGSASTVKAQISKRPAPSQKPVFPAASSHSGDGGNSQPWSHEGGKSNASDRSCWWRRCLVWIFFAHQWLSGVFAYCVVAVGSAHDANRCQKTEGMGRKACSVTLQHTMYSTVLLHDWRGKKGGAVLWKDDCDLNGLGLRTQMGKRELLWMEAATELSIVTSQLASTRHKHSGAVLNLLKRPHHHRGKLALCTLFHVITYSGPGLALFVLLYTVLLTQLHISNFSKSNSGTTNYVLHLNWSVLLMLG